MKTCGGSGISVYDLARRPSKNLASKCLPKMAKKPKGFLNSLWKHLATQRGCRVPFSIWESAEDWMTVVWRTDLDASKYSPVCELLSSDDAKHACTSFSLVVTLLSTTAEDDGATDDEVEEEEESEDFHSPRNSAWLQRRVVHSKADTNTPIGKVDDWAVVMRQERGSDKKQGRIHGHQLRPGGQGRKCAFSHFSTRSLWTNGPTDRRTDGRTKPLIELRVRN